MSSDEIMTHVKGPPDGKRYRRIKSANQLFTLFVVISLMCGHHVSRLDHFSSGCGHFVISVFVSLTELIFSSCL